MIGTLLESQAGGGSASTWIILVVLLVVLVLMYVFSAVRNKKYRQEAAAMLDALKPGDKVKTYSGIYGTVVAIRETTDGKVVTLETGDDKHKSYTSVDASVIYCMDKKQDIVYDAQGNVVEPDDDEEEAEVQDQNTQGPKKRSNKKVEDEVEDEVQDEVEESVETEESEEESKK